MMIKKLFHDPFELKWSFYIVYSCYQCGKHHQRSKTNINIDCIDLQLVQPLTLLTSNTYIHKYCLFT